MIKTIKSIFCILFCVSILFTAVGCDTEQKDPAYNKAGEVNIYPYFAYYCDGSTVEGLEDIDPEKENDPVSDDGSFVVYFEVSNNTEFDKKITRIDVEYIQDGYGVNLVEANVFHMIDDIYIGAGEKRIVECEYEKELVLEIVKIDELYSKATVSYEGCIIDGKDPEKSDEDYTLAIESLKFTKTNGIEGSLKIRNNTKFEKMISGIKFSLKTNTSVMLTNDPIEIELYDLTIESGGVETVNFAVLPKDTTQKIKSDKIFDTIEIIDQQIAEVK